MDVRKSIQSKDIDDIQSTKAFLKKLIDYAGLFPPARLPLEEAIQNYAAYQKVNDQWILGNFVIPVSILNNLKPYMHLFSINNPLPLSILGRKSDTLEECIKYLKEDLEILNHFRNDYGDRVQINVLELPLPDQIPNQTSLEQISNLTREKNLKLFCELTFSLSSNQWEESLSKSLEEIAKYNHNTNSDIGAKLRTGGIKPEMFPTPEQVAVFIEGCIKRNLKLKYTAGLHHPIRSYREEVNTKMHGFVNIFVGSMLAKKYSLDKNTMIEILSDENPNNFEFHSNKIFWKQFSISVAEIEQLRKQFCSYGSCSFDEPRVEIREVI